MLATCFISFCISLTKNLCDRIIQQPTDLFSTHKVSLSTPCCWQSHLMKVSLT